MKHLLLFLLLVLETQVAAAELTLVSTETGYNVLVDGQLFAGYVTGFQGMPIVYPIVGGTGKKMTRSYPMNDAVPAEEHDHPHHRSLWFAHGSVNGLDFWTADKNKSRCQIVHQKFLKIEVVNNTAVIQTLNHWTSQQNAILCSDIRTLRFGVSGSNRWIDFDITVKAEIDKVVFGDTKEGTFALRVAGKVKNIVNAEGKQNAAVWGQRSAWVDDTIETENEMLHIKIDNLPDSFRYPTYWHVREYGLFAANPFGVHDFENKTDKHIGDHTMQKGDTFTLRYRVTF